MKITPWCADDEASSFRHNELRDLEAEMLKIMVCNNFQKKKNGKSADTYEQSSGYPARHSRSWLLGAARICPGKGGTLGISGWGCAAVTLEPLTYTRASPPYPRVAVFQKLLRSLAQSNQNKTL